jgi:hypothetical protein
VLEISFNYEKKVEVSMPAEKAMDIEQGLLLGALKFLTPREIALIDELLTSVGEFGEVRLEVKNGKLRFASRTESVDALKWGGEDRKSS